MSKVIWNTKKYTEITLSDGTKITKTVGRRRKTGGTFVGSDLIKYSFDYENVSIPVITKDNNFPLWTMVHKLFNKEVQGVKDE